MTIERLLEAGRALETGRLELAERIYRGVAEADPRSSIAVVGLARVALARGTHDEAVRLAETALAIDPDNAAARRLVDEHHAGEHHAGDHHAGYDTGGMTAESPGAAGQVQPRPESDRQPARQAPTERGLLARLLQRGRR